MKSLPFVSSLPFVLVSVAPAVCPPLPGEDDEYYVVDREHSWAVVRSQTPDESQKNEAIAASEAALGLTGQWASPMAWDVVAIHSAVLPTGKVLQYSYPSGTSGSRARVWDPDTGNFSIVTWNQDLFCTGHSYLPDGRLFVTGGNDQGCDFKGLIVTNIFDPITETFTAQPNMEDARWYPTNVMLPDGRTLIFSGLDLACELNDVAEMYTPDGGISIVPEAQRGLQLYPRLHLLSDGRIAHVGPENQTYTLELGVGWQFVDWTNYGWRSQGTSVMLPGETDRIMIIGGNTTNTCEIIDFSDANPQWQYTTSMHHARAHADALILPDKTILAMGGGRDGLYGDPEYVPELYDPSDATWTELPAHVWPRMYHATTVLLKDGRVLVAGQDSGDGAWTGELYSPPYLFRGARPVIDTAPTRVVHGQTFSIDSAQAGSVDSVVLVRLSSVTHSVNFEQRLLDLPFMLEQDVAPAGGPTIRATVSTNEFEAVPGYYYLFVVNSAGVPSVAEIVQVSIPDTGDVDLDGDVDFGDILAVISAWGDCGLDACPADVNGDGTVSFADIFVIIANWT